MCRPGVAPSAGVLVTADVAWNHSKLFVRPYFENRGAELVTVDARPRLVHALLKNPNGTAQPLRVPEAPSRHPVMSRMGRVHYWVGIVPGSTVQLGSFLLPLHPMIVCGCLELELEYDTPQRAVVALAQVSLPPR